MVKDDVDQILFLCYFCFVVVTLEFREKQASCKFCSLFDLLKKYVDRRDVYTWVLFYFKKECTLKHSQVTWYSNCYRMTAVKSVAEIIAFGEFIFRQVCSSNLRKQGCCTC